MSSVISTPTQALALLRRSGILALVPTGALPSLVEAVCGERPKGSWWGHPRGKIVFELGTAIEGSGEALAVKLLRGKVAFVHQALWNEFISVMVNPLFRDPRVARLPTAARKLFERVESEGLLRDDRATKERKALADALLVHAEQIHTPQGSHATLLSPWTAWAKVHRISSRKLPPFETSLARLREACHGEPSAFDELPVRKVKPRVTKAKSPAPAAR